MDIWVIIMKKINNYTIFSFLVVALLSSSSLLASTLTTFEVTSSTSTSAVEDYQQANTGSISSSSTNTGTTAYSRSGVETGSGTGVANAEAYASETGVTSASVSGLLHTDNASVSGLDLSATSFYSIEYTNDFLYSVDFAYDYLIKPSYIELASNSVGAGAQAKASVNMFLGSDVTSEIVNLQWFNLGGNYGEEFSSTGDASFTEDRNLGYFRYDLGAVAGTFSGTLGIGESVTINTMLEAYVYGSRTYESPVGGLAYVGDPNGLSISGFDITPTGVSTVPVPAAAWLFGTGLLGLFGISRRRKT